MTTTLALSAAACQPFRGFAQGAHLAQGTLALHGSVTVPFVLAGNHIYIRAMLGKTRYAFLFDTGGVAAILPDVQHALHFEVTGEAQVHGVGAAAQAVEIVRVPEVSLGNLTYRNGSFLILPLPFLPQEPLPGLRFGGLLGREFFESLVTVIDYQDAKLTFYERGSFRADANALALPLALIDGHPNVLAAVNGHVGHFAVDAGARGGLTVAQSFAESSGLLKELGRTIDVVVAQGVGGAVTGTAARATSFALGSVRMSGPPVMIADSRGGGAFANAEVAGSIGGEILRRFTVTLDVPNATLYLRPNSRIAQPFAFNRAGLFSERDAGVETVVLVVAASPAWGAGVLNGDTIRTIDGIDVTRLTGDQMAGAWQGPPGTKLVLGLQRKGKPVRAALVLRDLI